MITNTGHATQSQPLASRESLRADLEATRRTFHALLDSVPEDTWLKKSPASDWKVKEVFLHITWALEYLPKEVEAARRGKGMFNLPRPVSDLASYWYIRWSARNAARESIRSRYDAAMNAAVAALESVPDTDWLKGADFYGEGFHTVADLFQEPAKHLAEHTAGM